MEANELMIGDWVNGWDGRWHPVCVSTISNYPEHRPTIVACGGYGYSLVDQVQPIPLTPEIMGKNCTLIEREYQFGEYPNILSIMYDSSARIRIMEGDCEYYGIEIKYVHELQHALRLAGIKKEIVL